MSIRNNSSVVARPIERPQFLPVVAALLSLVWKQTLYLYTMKVGRKYHSKGLIATAYDHLTDVYPSIATVLGTGIALLGQYIGYPEVRYADPIAGVMVSLFIFRTAYRMLRDSVANQAVTSGTGVGVRVRPTTGGKGKQSSGLFPLSGVMTATKDLQGRKEMRITFVHISDRSLDKTQ